MTKLTTIGILLTAAIFEAGGDALVRKGLHQQVGSRRWLGLLGGAVILLCYAIIVNTPEWDFGRLLGLYVVFFFLIAQLMSWAFFHQPPSMATLVGGALIVAGGIVLGTASR